MDVRARIAAAALASVSITTLSSALDAQPLPAQWSGFYLGGFAGGAWSASDATTTVPCPPFGGWICNAGAPLNGPVVAAAGTGSLNGSGFNGGGTFGYNWQFGGAVAGIETDFGAFGLHGSRTTVSRYVQAVNAPGGVKVGDAFSIGSTVDSNWLYTLRGRLGVLINPSLLAYATGGLAVANAKMSLAFADPYTGAAASTSATKTGFALGGGAEWKVNSQWSVKVEYLYVDLGSLSATATLPSTIVGIGGYSQSISTRVDLTAHIARAGINFKFP